MLRALTDSLIQAAFDRMVGAQRLDPRRDIEIQFAERELVEDGLEDLPYCRVVEQQAVNGQTGHAIP